MQDTLASARALWQAGDPAAARALVERLLLAQPAVVELLHAAADLDAALGRLAEASALYGRALALAPQAPVLHFGRADVARRLGDRATAIAGYRRALELAPRFFDALLYLGNLHHEAGEYAAAIGYLKQAVVLGPNVVVAHHNLALALAAAGDPEGAEVRFREAIRLAPDYAPAHLHRGLSLLRLARPVDAVEALSVACRLAPGDIEARLHLCTALGQSGDPARAVICAEQAVAADTANAEAWFALGRARAAVGELNAAIIAYRRALSIAPALAPARLSLMTALAARRDAPAAIDLLREGVALDPADAELRYFLTALLCDGGTAADALASARVLAGLAGAQPRYLACALYAQAKCCDWLGWDEQLARLDAALSALSEPADLGTPFHYLGLSDDPWLHQRVARAHALHYYGNKTAGKSVKRAAVAGARLRVAYVSADFRDHATSQLIAGLIDSHDRTRFEVWLVSLHPDDGSTLRTRLRVRADRFLDHELAAASDTARLLREGGVHIAVDLHGYTKGSRPAIFLQRPAPVVVNYLGYPGSCGSDVWDYLIADSRLIDSETADCYDEALVYLPNSYQPNDRERAPPERVPTRAECGLPADAIVLANLGANWKLRPDTYACWLRLLLRVPGTVLWLLADSAESEGNLRVAARGAGVGDSRLIFASRLAPAEHLARQACADLMLDTWPYNEHTTASEALWCGVPLVTRSGRSFASRVGASVLTAAGLPDLITRDAARYETLCVELASDRTRLAGLRRRVEAARDTCPLFDTQAYTRDLEAAYEEMWRRHVAGASRGPIDVRSLRGGSGGGAG